jgi:hypothetical protein
MSYLLTPNKPSSLKLIEVIENGSAKTFIYENPDKKAQSGIIAKLRAKIQKKLN